MGNDLAVYELPPLSAELEIDSLESDDLETVEGFISRIEATNDFLALVQGVAIVRIEREGLWQQGGYSSLNAYQRAQNARLNMPRQTISRKRRCAMAYLDNRKLFDKIDLTNRISKLQFVPDALKVYPSREVMSHFQNDNLFEFRHWARPQIKQVLPDVALRIRQGVISIDDRPVMSLAEDLADDERDFVAGLLRSAYRARRGNLKAHVVAVYDDGEARAVDSFLKRYRAKK